MKPTEASVTDRGVVVLIISLTLGIFVLDLILPPGVAGGVPYIAVVFLSLWLPHRVVSVIPTTIESWYGFSVPILEPLGGTNTLNTYES